MTKFTDIDERRYPYVSSQQARDAIARMVADYGLSFTHNPGGGELYSDKFGSCQIGMCNDVEDYEKVKSWLEGSE